MIPPLMKYLSLFSGIGGFERAIHKVFPEAICLGYSEIKSDALKVYAHHYPNHTNLGDITKITDEKLNNIVRSDCDLIVGGFPCTNLTSVAHIAKNGNSDGLSGPASCLFFNMLYIIQYILTHSNSSSKTCHFIIENNASMSKANRAAITKHLTDALGIDIHMCMINAASFGVQSRKRLFWTDFKVDLSKLPSEPLQTFDDVLEPLNKIEPHICSDTVILNSYNKIYTDLKSKSARLVLLAKKVGKSTWKFEQKLMIGKYTKWSQMALHSDTIHTLDNKINYKYPCGKMRTICGDRTIILDRRAQKQNCFVVRSAVIVELERLLFLPDGYVSCVVKSKQKCHKLLANSVCTSCIEFILKNI